MDSPRSLVYPLLVLNSFSFGVLRYREKRKQMKGKGMTVFCFARHLSEVQDSLAFALFTFVRLAQNPKFKKQIRVRTQEANRLKEKKLS